MNNLAVTAESIPTQKAIRVLLEAQRPRALALADIPAMLGETRRTVFDAARHMSYNEKVFCFSIDGHEHVCLHEDRFETYADRGVTFHDRGIERLYAGFGIRLPAVMRRTPPFVPLADEAGSGRFNRYRESEEALA